MFALIPSYPDSHEIQHSYFEHVLSIPLDPHAAFALMLDTERDADWFPGFKSARWLSPAPYDVGAVREYVTGQMRALELFTHWQPGERVSFTFIALSLPIVDRFVEDYHFRATRDGATEITWRVSYAPSIWIAPALSIVRRYFAADFETAARNIARLCNGRYVRGRSVPADPVRRMRWSRPRTSLSRER